MKTLISCILGAGYSFVAGIPLARDLFRPFSSFARSGASYKRFEVVRGHYLYWLSCNPGGYPEQYMGLIFAGMLKDNPPKWEWVVEYVSASMASAGAPPASQNLNPRYSNRVNRPLACDTHRIFWRTVLGICSDLSVITTNYDILIERALRHRPMQRPPLPGCFYGGLPRPQWLKGAAQPFSRWSPERLIEMSGTVPLYNTNRPKH